MFMYKKIKNKLNKFILKLQQLITKKVLFKDKIFLQPIKFMFNRENVCFMYKLINLNCL